MAQADVQRPRFVYVEDDIMSREIVRVLIQEVLGFRNITIFEDSADLLQRLESLPSVPDVFFLDVQIGPHDGYQMLRMLRESPAYKQAIIIAMTANVMSYDIDQLRGAGFDGLIGKPVRKKVFPELVEKLLNGESVWYVP